MRNLVITFLFSCAAIGSEPALGWLYVGEKNIYGYVFDVYQSQDGDQVAVKRRTPQSENPTEVETPLNLPDRQSTLELGLGWGFSHASKNSLQWEKDGVTGVFGDLYDGRKTVNVQNKLAVDFQMIFRPPVRNLKRLALGATMPFNISENSKIPADGVAVSKGNSAWLNWQVFGEYDIIIKPRPKFSQIFSAGYYLGSNQTYHSIDKNALTFKGPRRLEDGVVTRYRWIYENGGAFNNFYILGKFSRDGGIRLTSGVGFLLGKRNQLPKVVEK